jgi:hypothetical protein
MFADALDLVNQGSGVARYRLEKPLGHGVFLSPRSLLNSAEY